MENFKNKEAVLKTAYQKLGITLKAENTTLSMMKNLLIAQWNDYNKRAPFPIRGDITDFFRIIANEEHMDDETKKELFFDKYIYIMYKNEVLKAPEKEQELNQIYNLIRDRKHRAKYKKVEEYYKKVEIEKQNVEQVKYVQRNLGRNSLTVNTTSINVLNKSKEKNKQRVDPGEEWILYTGFPYRWRVNFNAREENLCILDDINLKGERVIVTDLGNFEYETNIGRPCEEYPEGKATFGGYSTILGITKLGAKNQILSNDVMIANLNPDDLTNNKRFFVDVFLCDELIKHAEAFNKSFLGKISIADLNGEPQYYIEYNGICDRELVTALGAAKHVGGNVKIGPKSRFVNNFDEIRKKLLELQEEYVMTINGIAPEVEERGESLCQK